MRHLRTWKPWLVTILALLVACTGPSGEVAYLTPSEAGDHVLAISEDMSAILGGLVVGGPAEALWFTGSVGVFPAPTPGFIVLVRDDVDAPPRLATGTFTYDEAAMVWDYDPAPASGLVLRWTPSEPGPPPEPSTVAPTHELAFAWTGAVPVTLPTGEVVDGPTGTAVLFTVDGTVAGDLTLEQAWRQTDCGLLAEARTFVLAGTIGNFDAGATFRDLGVTSPADGRWRMTGGVDAYAGALTMSLDVDLAVDVEFERSVVTCWPMPESVERIDASVDVDLASPGRDAELVFGATVEDNPAAGWYDLEFRAGRAVVGSKRVTFEGAIPADAEPTLMLTFANGVKLTLEEFVFDYLVP